MKFSTLLSIAAAQWCFIFFVIPSYSQDLSPANIKNRTENIRKNFEILKNKEALPSINFSSVIWKLNDEYDIDFPSESTEHSNGLYNVDHVIMSSAPTEPPLIGFYSDSHVRLVTGENIKSGMDCLKVATDFAHDNFSWFFSEDAPSPTIEGPNYLGDYSFTWQKYQENELPGSRVFIRVRCLDGKVTSFSSSQLAGEWEHKIKPSEAKVKALNYLTANGKSSNVTVDAWYVSGGGGKRWYSIRAKMFDPVKKRTFYTLVEVDAEDGTIFHSTDGWVEGTSGLIAPVKDRLPIWTKSGLVFVSNRPLANRPGWLKYPEQLYFQSPTRNISYITCDLADSQISDLSGSRNSDWLAFRFHQWSYGLDMQAGKYSALGTPGRPISQAAISPDGLWSIGSVTSSTGVQDEDLMTYPLTADTALGLRGRMRRGGSDENNATFSPDGKWLYYSTAKMVGKSFSEAICRVPAKLVKQRGLFNIPKGQEEVVLAKLPEDLHRLSVSSDGKFLVAQLSSQVALINIEKRDLHTVPLASLQDKGSNSSRILKVQDGWAGPGANEITFSGQTKQKGVERWRIYSCRFDGTYLRDWTPADPVPVPSYTFTQTSKKADEVNKAMVIQEIAWEDKQKPRNN